ncbi:MAG TPA: hypothetical protein VGO75_14655 [Gemmatimonadaceae bacterium]|nr:hypothetical protein [Gemmatimonadaceae bacterium]
MARRDLVAGIGTLWIERKKSYPPLHPRKAKLFLRRVAFACVVLTFIGAASAIPFAFAPSVWGAAPAILVMIAIVTGFVSVAIIFLLDITGLVPRSSGWLPWADDLNVHGYDPETVLPEHDWSQAWPKMRFGVWFWCVVGFFNIALLVLEFSSLGGSPVGKFLLGLIGVVVLLSFLILPRLRALST